MRGLGMLGPLLVSGCATFRELPPETRAAEAAWQAMHGIDTAQTLSIARDPDCYAENMIDPLIGRHPPQGMVLAWGVGAAALHLAVTNILNTYTRQTVVHIWQGITIVSTAAIISHNFSIGIRFTHTEPKPGQCGEHERP